MVDVFDIPLSVLDPSGIQAREADGRVDPTERQALSQMDVSPLRDEPSDVQIESSPEM